MCSIKFKLDGIPRRYDCTHTITQLSSVPCHLPLCVCCFCSVPFRYNFSFALVLFTLLLYEISRWMCARSYDDDVPLCAISIAIEFLDAFFSTTIYACDSYFPNECLSHRTFSRSLCFRWNVNNTLLFLHVMNSTSTSSFSPCSSVCSALQLLQFLLTHIRSAFGCATRR